MDAKKQVYFFSVQDPNPECLTFGCVATSLDAATLKASIAGFQDVLLLEVRDLRGSELSQVANEEIVENPFLGPVWLPLVDELAAAVRDLSPGQFFALNWLAREYGYDQNQSPYIQGMQEADGSLHLELGSPQLIASLSDRSKKTMEFMGWNEPDDGIPNYFRIFEPGWNIRHVAYVALQTLVVAFGIDVTDIIVPGGHGMSKFGRLGLLDRLDESRGLKGLVGYGLLGLNLLADTAETSAETSTESSDDEAVEEDFDDDADYPYFATENREAGGYQFDGDEPVGNEEPVYYGGAMTFRDADDIFELLESANIIDVRGRPSADLNPKYDDENGVCLLGQGKKYGSSCYSGDDVDRYFIDAEVWTQDDFDRFASSAAFAKARLVDDPDVLALIGGDNWAVWITRGARDAEIHPNIVDIVLEVIGQGVVLFAKPIPEPERPESRFRDAMELLREIAGSKTSPAVHVQLHDWPHIDEVIELRGGDDYLREAFSRKQFISGFTSVTWENSGQMYRLDHDILMEDHFGKDNPRWLDVYFPDPRPSRYVADDGWVVRITGDIEKLEILDMAAAAIKARLGGEIYEK